MQQPANIGGELLRLRTGKQHAVIECVQKAVFAHPAFFFNENAMHHADLPGRAAETEGRDAAPNAEGFAEGDAVGGGGIGRRGVRHAGVAGVTGAAAVSGTVATHSVRNGGSNGFRTPWEEMNNLTPFLLPFLLPEIGLLSRDDDLATCAIDQRLHHSLPVSIDGVL